MKTGFCWWGILFKMAGGWHKCPLALYNGVVESHWWLSVIFKSIYKKPWDLISAKQFRTFRIQQIKERNDHDDSDVIEWI